MNHSLSAAVAAGVITEEAAFCGLFPADLQALAFAAPLAKVLIRFRSSTLGDGRHVTTAKSAHSFTLTGHGIGTDFPPQAIRDITAVALSVEESLS